MICKWCVNMFLDFVFNLVVVIRLFVRVRNGTSIVTTTLNST